MEGSFSGWELSSLHLSSRLTPPRADLLAYGWQVGPKQFERVLDMVSKVRSMGMEVCTTLGMLTKEQAEKLKVAGLSCYNHNIDTSPEYYPKITGSRNYEDRLDTLQQVTLDPPPLHKRTLCTNKGRDQPPVAR